MNVHIFRRDLNLLDNEALFKLSSKYKNINYMFFFNKQQYKNNNYYNDYQFNFMVSYLNYLSSLINITFYFINKVEDEIKILKTLTINSISFNKDYTPYAKYRDNLIIEYCNTNNIELFVSEFYYWTRPLSKVYYKFSSFYNKYDTKKIPIHECNIKYSKHKLNNLFNIEASNKRDEALEILNNKYSEYSNSRNMLSYKTTEIGIYMKFCVVTSREVFNTYIHNKGIIRELIFRDFFYTLDYTHPNYFETKTTKRKIEWDNNKTNINKFLNGQTGELIIDAAISQLKTTNYMHNRCRMLCVNYLVKHLNESWEHGEHLFAIYLKDYDPIINFQNWVYMSGLHIYNFTYYRIFNYERQIKLYDGKYYINKFLKDDYLKNTKIEYDKDAKKYIKKIKNSK